MNLSDISFTDVTSAISGLLIIIYGLTMAWPKICENVGWFSKKQQKKKEKEEEKLKVLFDKFFEGYSDKLAKMHDDLTDKYMDKYVPPITEKFDTINENNEKILRELDENQVALIRSELVQIYELYKDEEKIPNRMKEEFLKLYSYYKARKGNHYIDDMVAPKVLSWEVVDE